MMLTLQIKLILLAVAFVGLAGGGWYVHHRIYQSGFDDSKAISDEARARERQQALYELVVANTEAATKEEGLRLKISELSTQHTKEMENAKVKIDGLLADVRTGKLRLSIAIAARPKTECGASSATSSGPGSEERVELMPETAANLIDIAADGDRAVRQLNGCIDAYNAVRKTINGESP